MTVFRRVKKKAAASVRLMPWPRRLVLLVLTLERGRSNGEGTFNLP